MKEKRTYTQKLDTVRDGYGEHQKFAKCIYKNAISYQEITVTERIRLSITESDQEDEDEDEGSSVESEEEKSEEQGKSNDHGYGENLRHQEPLLPGLDDESALRCFSLLSLSDLRKIAVLSSRHRSLMKSGLMLELRRNYGVLEHFVFLSIGPDPSAWLVYDVQQDSWQHLPPVHAYSSSSSLESMSVTSHVIWLDPIGNFDYRYDHLSNQWEEAPSMVKRRSLFASASSGEFAYVAGGFARPYQRCASLKEEVAANVLQTAEMYNALSSRWESIPPMPNARFRCSGFIMNDKFYVIGGKDLDNRPLLSAEEYDPVLRTWKTIENMYFADVFEDMFDSPPPLVAVVQNRLYAVEVSTNTLKVYESDSNSWGDLGLLPVSADIGNGWAVTFKALGDGLFVMGDLGGLLCGCWWWPAPDSCIPAWEVLFNLKVQPLAGRNKTRILYNCPVMSC